MGKDNELLEAARNGNVVVVEKLLSTKAKRGGPLASLRRGPGANVQDACGYSALHHAALNGHREIVVLLLQNEASPNIVDSKGSTPLHLAAWAGHTDIVRLLLTSGVRVTQINIKNKDNETALHCGAQYGHTAVVNLLLNHGADPSVRNIKDETALDLAALYGRLETVDVLIRTHPELIAAYRISDSTNSSLYKITPLHAASRNGHRGVVDTLLKAGFPVSLRTLSGTALHEAALCGKVDVVRRLLEAGIDVDLKDSNGKTPLQIVQELSTPVAQEITSLIKNSALLADLPTTDDTHSLFNQISHHPLPGERGFPYENVIPSQSHDFSFTSATESYITLPRRRTSRMTSSSSRSQKSDVSVYEVPPVPRSLPWLEKANSEREDTLSSSQSDLLSDDSAFGMKMNIQGDSFMSRSYEERSSGLMSMSTMSCPPCDTVYANENTAVDNNCNPFTRTSRNRHSVDHYLPMNIPSLTRVSPNPPQKPPRRAQFVTSRFESLPRASASHRSRHTTIATSESSSGYELVYMARTGSRNENGENNAQSNFRVHSSYVEMAPVPKSFGNSHTSYENVSPCLAVEEPDYDIPRDLGSSKAYENVSFSFCVDSSHLTPTPTSPSLLEQPPTPDHPPPPAHLAERSIHEAIGPLSEELKRKSRDIETETEEELFLTLSNASETTPGSGSVSLSLSDKSVSTDNIEEITSDKPFAGLLRGSVILNRSVERPKTLRTKSGSTNGQNSTVSESDNMSSGSSGSRRGTNSLAVLSPFDEQEEWAKITEILGSFNTGLSKESQFSEEVQREIQIRLDSIEPVRPDVSSEEIVDLPTDSKDTVFDWLVSTGLQQYLYSLINNGFDDIQFLGSDILDETSLIEMGICDEDHRKRLKESAILLPTPIEKIRNQFPDTIEEWLRLLKLERYLEQFKNSIFCDVDRVKRVWEVELTTLIEIRKLGHLRRILLSLPKDRNREYLANLQNHSTDNKEDMKELASDLQKISAGIAILEGQISQKLTENSEACNKNTATLNRRKSRPAPPPPSAKMALNHPIDQLVIRDPSELVVGIAKTLTTQWRHPPQALIRSGISYEAEYLGSTLVRQLKGTESTKRSIQKLKKKHAGDSNKCTRIALDISYTGVQFKHPTSRESICYHEIRNIHCACQDADDLTHFAYITKDHETQDHFCHVFRVPTMDLATEIILTLGQAFEVAYQLALREEVVQPMMGTAIQEPNKEYRSSELKIVEPPTAKLETNLVSHTIPQMPLKKPKPTELPPKPKFGTIPRNPGNIPDRTKPSPLNSHARSFSSSDCSPSINKGNIENTSTIESTLIHYKENNLPRSSSTSISSAGSVRAPLATTDEL